MARYTYIGVINQTYPDLQCHVVGGGDAYEQIVWGPDVTTPPTKAELDALIASMETVDTPTGNSTTITGTVAGVSGTSRISPDTSSILSGEGTVLWSATVAPLSTSSKKLITFSTIASASNSSRIMTLALFRDNVCISSTCNYLASANQPYPASISFVDTPGTTAPVTYSVRAGINGSGTWYIARTPSITNNNTTNSTWAIMEI
jgi:hypothetical protein